MALSDATENSFGYTGDPTMGVEFALIHKPEAANAPAQPKNEGLSTMEDSVALDFFTGGAASILGAANPGFNMGMQAISSAADFADEQGLQKGMQMEHIASQKPAYAPSPEPTSFSGKSKTSQGFHKEQPTVRPSDSDGRRRVIDMRMTPQMLGAQMSAPTLGGPR